jgi:hypothetical protein
MAQTLNNNSEVKIQFLLDPADDQGMVSESLPAEHIAPDEFRIIGSPFFAFGVSKNDIVSAEQVGNTFEFRSVVTPGGHSTYRVYLQSSLAIHDSDVQEFWQPISALGATYESANSSFFAIDVPPGKNIAEIYKLLEAGEAAEIWEFEEACYEGDDETLEG